MTDLAHLFDAPESLALYRVKRERDQLREALAKVVGHESTEAVYYASPYQDVENERGPWRIAVARHSKAPTFTFDIEVPAAQTLDLPLNRRVLSCHNMTRADLEEHVRRCQMALAQPDREAQS